MSKNKQPNYYNFAMLLFFSLIICSALIAVYAGFTKANPKANITNQWFFVMALLFTTLVFLFFSIKRSRHEYRRRVQAEKILTNIIARVRFLDTAIKNDIVVLMVEQIVIKPSDYQEFLRSLGELQGTLTEFCLREEIYLREEASKSLLNANTGGAKPDSFSASENLIRIARKIARYEQIRSFCN